jgi:3'(2'), 5'-bisphosphate nucleotidase
MFSDFHLTAIQATIDASKVIMEVYQEDFDTEYKEDGSPVTKADLLSSNLIVQQLQATKIPIICEEIQHEKYQIRRNWKQFWCVDPLDGTREFVKKNGEFAVNIALVENQIPVFGVISSPVNQELVFGGLEMGVYYTTFENFKSNNWTKIEISTKPKNLPLVLISSRSYFTGSTLNFVNQLKKTNGEIQFIQKGSALKFIDLVLGKADIYPRFAPTMEWDTAAGHALLIGIDGEIKDIDGKNLLYNKKSLLNPHFIARKKSFKGKN